MVDKSCKQIDKGKKLWEQINKGKELWEQIDKDKKLWVKDKNCIHLRQLLFYFDLYFRDFLESFDLEYFCEVWLAVIETKANTNT